MYCELSEDMKENIWFSMYPISELNIFPKDIPVKIWIHGAEYTLDIPVIHFQNNYSEKPTTYNNMDSLISMRIWDQEIINSKRIRVKKEDIEKIKKWVKLNKKF